MRSVAGLSQLAGGKTAKVIASRASATRRDKGNVASSRAAIRSRISIATTVDSLEGSDVAWNLKLLHGDRTA